jgi:plasmid stability protein
MPLPIVGFYWKRAVIILTGGSDYGHYAVDVVESARYRNHSDDSTVSPRDFGGRSRLVASLYAINDCIAIIDCMASITIRNLETETKRKLKIRAAMNGRSMEQEAREILKSTLAQTSRRKANLAERIHEIFGPLGGVELERLPRDPVRDPDWLAERE